MIHDQCPYYDAATPAEISPLSLHDALPIGPGGRPRRLGRHRGRSGWSGTDRSPSAGRPVILDGRERRRLAGAALPPKEAAAWTDRMAEALGRWKVHGAPEAGRLDGLLAQGEEAVQELTTRRDHRVESLAELDARRNGASRMLGTFERDIDALRDRLDGIDRPFEAKGQAERSFLRARAGLDYNPDHGIRRDLGHGLGR